MEKAGVKLVADGASQYIAALQKAAGAQAGFNAATAAGAGDAKAFAAAASKVDLAKLNNQLDDQRTRLGILGQELVTVAGKYGDSSIQAQKKQAALDRLTGQMSITMDKTLALEVAIDKEAKASSDAAGNTSDLRKGFTGLATDADKAKGGIDSFAQIAIGGLRKLGEIGVQALGNLAQSFGSFLKSSVGVAGDYESSLNKFAAVTGSALGAAGLTTEQFSAKFLELGAKTQFSAAQAADAANELAKGGVGVAEIMGEATEATLALASAGELELAPAATIIAKQLGVWGDAAGGAAAVTDILAQTANASTVNVEDLALGLANVGGVAKGAGLSFAETVQAVGLIAPGFSSAADAGTSFKTFINQLVPTTNAAKDAMSDLGLFTEETGSAFYDAQGNFVGMEKATGLLHDATAGLTTEQRALAMETIFGADAQRAALLLAEKGTEGYVAFGKAMEATGTATDQATAKNKGFNFAMESLGGSVETFQIKLGQKLLPILTDVINKGLIPLANWAADNVGPAIDALARGFGDFATGLKTVVNFIDDNAIPVFTTLATGLGAFAVTSIVGAVAGLGGLGGAFIAAAGAAGTFVTSVAVAAAPLALLAASLYLVYEAGNKFQEVSRQVHDGSLAVLEAIPWWNEAAAAEGNFNEVAAGMSPTLKAQYDLLHGQREALYGLTQQYALGNISQADYETQGRALRDEIKAGTTALNEGVAAERDRNQAVSESLLQLGGIRDSTTSYTETLALATGAVGGYGAASALSSEQVAALAATIASATTAGIASLGEMETGYRGHYQNLAALQVGYGQAKNDEERASIQGQINEQIIGYAEQERIQREALGRQLIALTIAEAEKNGVSGEALVQMTTALATEYGVQQSVAEQTFGAMSGSIEAWAAAGGTGTASFMEDLRETGDTAFETHKTVAEMQGTYEVILEQNFKEGQLDAETFQALMQEVPTTHTLELFQNFLDGKTSADEFLKAVNAIPAQKNVTVHTSYTSSGERPTNKGGAEARAEGGPVQKNVTYLVGERGFEAVTNAMGGLMGFVGVGGKGFFTAPNNGMVIPHDETESMLARGALQEPPASFMPSQTPYQPPASQQQIMQRALNQVTNTTTTYQYAPVYQSAPVAPSLDFRAMELWSGR